MTAVPSLFQRLVDDAAVFPPGNAAVADAVPAHLRYRSTWFASMVGPLVVPDHKLGQVGQALRQAQGTSPEPSPPTPPLPESRSSLPESRSPLPESRSSFPESRSSFPESRSSFPESRSSFPESRSSFPESRSSLPESRSSLPELVEGPLDVSVVNTSGAGGIVSLAGRSVPGIRVVAVETALRDLDDLAGNAARVVSAAAELDEEVRVFVEIPFAQGWERAVDTVEAAGLLAKLRTGGEEPQDHPSADRLARQLSVLVEADLPFKATAGLHHAVAASGSGAGRPRHGFLNLMVALEALVEGATEADAAQLLLLTDAEVLAEQVAAWNETDATRVRRRLLSFGCCGVQDPVGDLVELGLLAGTT